jgi:DNA adenine methylase
MAQRICTEVSPLQILQNGKKGKEIVTPFLKWAGGKTALLPEVLGLLPKGDTLIEPFAGSMAVSLNADFANYIVSDTNVDLINLYNQLKLRGQGFADYCSSYFISKYQTEDEYYRLRDVFNSSKDLEERAALMLYLNKHCFNGLFRPNKQGLFNVPVGRNSNKQMLTPTFPMEKVQAWMKVIKSKNFLFLHGDFRKVVRQYQGQGVVVYADPPYIPLPKAQAKSSDFTAYTADGFTLREQQALAALAEEMAAKGVPSLISNSHTPKSLEVFANGQIHVVEASRSISAEGKSRGKVQEILVLYK